MTNNEGSKNKVILEAMLSLENLPLQRRKEIASQLSLPENDQKDLLFVSAILVSTGTNANGATFLGSELVKAKDSINQKPLNKEHQSDKVVGHISSSLYMTYTGDILDQEDLYGQVVSENAAEQSKIISELDNTDMDIGIICVVYKDCFPDIAEEIKKGEWKVSMECYYEDFDLKIGNTIVSKSSASGAKEKAIDSKTKEAIDSVLAGNKVVSLNVSRVLRNIRFCGCGFVKNPAEKRSVVLEAANHMKKTVSRELVEGEIREAAAEASPFIEDSLEGEVVQLGACGYLLLKNGKPVEDECLYFTEYNQAQQEAITRTAIAEKVGEDVEYTILELDSKFIPRSKAQINETSEAVVYKTGDNAKIKEIINIGDLKEEADSSKRIWGPKDNPAGICISFKRYKYEYPGSSFPGKIVATNWCQKYQKPCPVMGADALDPTCLRNIYGKAYETELDKVATSFNEEAKEDSSESLNQYIDTPVEVETEVAEEVTPEPEAVKEEKAVIKKVSKKKVIVKPQLSLSITDAVTKITRQERAELDSKCFGLPKTKEFPLHTEELIKATMDYYPELSNSLKTFSNKRELFNNIIYNALRLGVDTNEFEKGNQFKFREGEEFSEEYGIPRLKLFPLESREQVIAAISRYSLLKADLSDREKDMLVINILRAATKFNIDVSRFRDKVKNN